MRCTTLLLAAGAAAAAGAPRGGRATRGDASRDAAREYAEFTVARARHDARKAAGAAAGAPTPDYSTGVWPLPAQLTPVGNVALDPADFEITCVGATNAVVANAMLRYKPLILFHPAGVSPAASAARVKTLAINVSDGSVTQIVSTTDESYTLAFSGDLSTATLSAPNAFGALRGLETFSQLVDADKWSGLYSVSAATVVDAPRYGFRGLLVDAARHWLPPKLLLTIMDGLMYAKMNTLKVVLGCDWSWTVQSKLWPNLTLASYYSQHQVRARGTTHRHRGAGAASRRGCAAAC
jgi:hexosaminidase